MSHSFLLSVSSGEHTAEPADVALLTISDEMRTFLLAARDTRDLLVKRMNELAGFVPGLNDITFFDSTPDFIRFDALGSSAPVADWADLHQLVQAIAYGEADLPYAPITSKQAVSILAACMDWEDAICRLEFCILEVGKTGLNYKMAIKHTDQYCGTCILPWSALEDPA